MQNYPWQKNLVRLVAFCLALLAAVLLAGHFLMPKSNRYLSGYTAGGILGEDFDTIDVLVMGDSNAAQGIAPMEWYTENGITGYTYGSGWMTIYNIYYRLKTIYTEQAPKVVVLCTAPVYSKKGTETYTQSAISNIAGELLPLVRFHDNWKQVKPGNLFADNDYGWRDVNKGFTPITDVGAYMSGDFMAAGADATAAEPIYWLVEFYLDAIVRLCAENGSELVLITVPATSWNLARHNGIAAYAEKAGLVYKDYNMPANDPGINWHTDTPDGGAHLNVLGARKNSIALGAYLAANFDLPDHRGQPGYEDWDADAAEYAAALPEQIADNEAAAAYQLQVIGENAQK